jgi:hypothetical protein
MYIIKNVNAAVLPSQLRLMKSQRFSKPSMPLASENLLRTCASKSDYPHVVQMVDGGASLAFTKPDLGQSLDDFDPAMAMRTFSQQSQENPGFQHVRLQQASQKALENGAMNSRSNMSWKDIV